MRLPTSIAEKFELAFALAGLLMLLVIGFALTVFMIALPTCLLGEHFAEKRAVAMRNSDQHFAQMKRDFRFGGWVRFWLQLFRSMEGASACLRCRSAAVRAMAKYAQSGGTDAERDEIARLARDALNKVVVGRVRHDFEVSSELLSALSAAAPAWQGDFLEKIIDAPISSALRGHAIKQLTHLQGAGALPVLLRAMVAPELVIPAAEALAQLGPSAAIPEVIDRLVQITVETQETSIASRTVQALLALGEADNPALVANLDKLAAWTRFAVRVKAARLSAQALIERFFAAGILAERHRNAVKPSTVNRMRKALNSGDGFAAVIPVLQRLKAMWSFEAEWGGPPEYDTLLRTFSKVWPEWPITGIALRMDDADPEICREVNFKIGGLPARFQPRWMDDWVDAEMILDGLNAAMEVAGRTERFAVLLGDDHHFVMGNPDALQDLALTFDLPLLSSSTEAIMAANFHA